MKNSILVRTEDLINNPTPRIPICLCLDTSGSMDALSGNFKLTGKTCFKDGKEWNVATGGVTRLSKLQDGLEIFYNAIKTDEIASASAEICIVEFNDNANCILDFANIKRQKIPNLKTSGNTAMGKGVNLALDLLEKRKEEYREKGVDYYQPWLVLMTDGEPNGNPKELSRAIERTRKMIENRKLTIFPIGIGDEAGMETLQKFSPNRQPLKLKGLKFKEFFTWLSQSVSRTSQSMPGEKIQLDIEKIKSWGEL
ncbi:hypothetical protein OSSY52_18730 [Tepiditoga spiralis]|uniref:VWFA domain-containing protein n=1 Tax=Tepiditoga spiralis TaxID=2108365 RepID=A0A7G1GBF0_9BACT|nr:VWA domain-containing protein [Tepiditoga spiralis]BBE31732.1 hypothetical protein OSSY52_18730 [Tepiditoga spiralis]